MRALLPLLFLLATPAAAESFARIQTSMGDIDVVLDDEAAPKSVENFLAYATSGYYDRLVFHRVVPGTLIQGGGMTPALYPRAASRDPVPNEAAAERKNVRGTIAMARYDDPDSATSQFFINLKDNPDFDRTGDEWKKDAGYAVFGRVVAGMAVADAIGAVETGPGTPESGLAAEVPTEPVTILRIDPIEKDEVGAE